MTHEWKLRVYFEDTDAGGVVYYANYLKFIERARTEMLREFGVPHADMMKDAGAQFVVRRCAIDYVKPARLEDELTVRTALLECGAASLTLKQDVVRNGMDLAKAEVVLACVNNAGAPCRIPAAIRTKIDMLSGQKVG